MAKKITPVAPTPATPTSATPATPVAPPTPAPPPADPNDPVELQLLKSQADYGTFRIFARVLNIMDKGLNGKKIVFTSQGEQKSGTTNDQGDTAYPDLLVAPADGSELKITAHVSGIRGFSVMHFIRRDIKTPTQIAKDLENNKRAKIFFWIAIGLWIACLLAALCFGLGKPLIDFSQTSLTDQQIYFNNLPGVKGSSFEVMPSPMPSGTWQKPFFLLVMLWTIFSIIYGILAFREEVVEIFHRGIEKLVDKHYMSASARDPLLERLLAFSGHLVTARSPLVSSFAAEPTATSRLPFWQLFRSDLMSDLLVDIGPKILSTIFKRS